MDISMLTDFLKVLETDHFHVLQGVLLRRLHIILLLHTWHIAIVVSPVVVILGWHRRIIEYEAIDAFAINCILQIADLAIIRWVP